MPEYKLLLDDEELFQLKVLAAKQRVRPQTIARDAFRLGMQAATGLGKTLPTASGEPLAYSPNTIQAREAIDVAIAALEGARRALGTIINGSDRTIDNGLLDVASGITRASAELGGSGESVAEDRNGVGENGGEVEQLKGRPSPDSRA